MDPILHPNIRPVHHQYGTRIRQNSVLKPSARLRQSPDPPIHPRKIKPIPSSLPQEIPQVVPQFPPPHVMLHPEDANSKVFLAIGRSFLSVNNCAMTIKDLAEMTLNFGLICQNVSAAGQAITTYIRTHMQRCEVQQDHPLLLRHILSGTPSDDDLLPALHSRTGGAHCSLNSETRATNFRRGTMVWYLSKATGSPCPFARAGIRLCEYGENGRVVGSDRKREQDNRSRAEICGQKRKRSLRGCADKSSESESDSDHGNRPPKVKLTLRLRPCMTSFSSTASSDSRPKQVIDLSRDSDSGDEYISVDSSDDEDSSTGNQEPEEPWSLPPYPRRSISIPRYTPCDDPYPSHAPEPSDLYRRSPSVPFSVASPPPDSEDEDDDYHITMTGTRRYSAERLRPPAKPEPEDFDADSDAEGESETLWESPGPRSPSAPLMIGPTTTVVVKQEPGDVQGMLDAWEDFDCTIADTKVVEVVAAAAASVLDRESTSKVKVEPLELWDWEGAYQSASPDWYPTPLDHDETMHVKQEEFDFDSTLMSLDDVTSDDSSPLSPLSSLSLRFSNFGHPRFHNFALRRHSELTWQDAELLGPDSIHPQEFEEGEWEEGKKNFITVRRARISTSLPSLVAKPPSLLTSPSMYRELPSASSTATIRGQPFESAQPSVPPTPSLASLVQALSIGLPVQGDSVSPSSLADPPTHESLAEHARVVVVHTCHPCNPPISATQVEGISVYRMVLGSSPLLRRIDTDFVNLSPIANHLGIASPLVTSTPNAMVIAKGSLTVLGTWVPLECAQTFIREYPLPGNLLDIFLSDTLFERFPSALQDFHRSNAPGRLINQFGLHFNSTLEAQRHSQLPLQTDMPFSTRVPWEREPVSNWDVEDHLLAIYPPSLPEHAMQSLPDDVGDTRAVEAPLSATEQEMFHALCVIPDWEKENSSPAAIIPLPAMKCVTVEDEPPVDTAVEDRGPPAVVADRPLRRSKRVANAIAVRSRTRSGRRNSRNSLS